MLGRVERTRNGYDARRGKGSVNGNGERHDNAKADEDGTTDGEMEEERTVSMVEAGESIDMWRGEREECRTM